MLSWCQLCPHCQHCRLSLWQPAVLQVVTKLALGQLSVFTVLTRRSYHIRVSHGNTVTHLWPLVIIGLGNGLLSVRYQATAHTNVDLFSTGLWGIKTNKTILLQSIILLCGNIYKKKSNCIHIYIHIQSGTKSNLVAKIWLPTLVTICNGLPKLVANISSHTDHLVNTGLAVGSLVKWLPIKVATPANQTQFEWFIARRL